MTKGLRRCRFIAKKLQCIYLAAFFVAAVTNQSQRDKSCKRKRTRNGLTTSGPNFRNGYKPQRYVVALTPSFSATVFVFAPELL